MKIGVEDEEWNVVKTFDNLKEADDFIHSDERELTLIYQDERGKWNAKIQQNNIRIPLPQHQQVGEELSKIH